MTNKILIVDDNDLIRNLLRDIFNDYGLKTTFAANGQEAIDIFTSSEFRVVLMEIDMPIMGGLKATRMIRKLEKKENRKRTPIVAITGTTISNCHLKCSDVGMDGFITKPATISEILDIVLPLIA